MNSIKILLIFSIITVMVVGCASPQKSYSKGDYEKAYKLALKKMKKGQRTRKDIAVLNKSYNEILKERSNTIDRYLASNVIDDWELAYQEYDKLIDIYYDGKQYLDQEYDETMSTKDTEFEKLRTDIAINYLDLGHMKMDQFHSNSNKIYAQEAYEYYKKTEYYDPQLSSLDSLISDSFENAIINVYIEADSRWDYSFNWIIDRKFSSLDRTSKGYYRMSYEDNQALADCTLEIQFSSLELNRSERSDTERFSERIEDGYETSQDTSGKKTQIPKYITVTGEVTTIREITEYQWRVRVDTYGPREYCDFSNRNFDAEEELIYERYEFSGDRRAIPDNYSDNNFNQRDEDEIIDELLDELYSDIERYYF